MAYTPQAWADNPEGGTPVTAARLNALEQALAAALTEGDANALYVTLAAAANFLTIATADPIFVSHDEAEVTFVKLGDEGAESTFDAFLPVPLGREPGDFSRVGTDTYILTGAKTNEVRDSFTAGDGTQLSSHQPETYPDNNITWLIYGGTYPYIEDNKVRLFDNARTGITLDLGAGPQAYAIDIVTGATTVQRPTFEINRGAGGVYRFSATGTQITLERDATVIDSVASTVFEALGSTRRVQVEWDGTDTLRFIVDGTVLLTHTDATPLAATGAGIVITGIGGADAGTGRNFFDNFIGSNTGTLDWDLVFDPATLAAAGIPYAGSTNLAATTVEAALDELDAEKAPNGHTHAFTIFNSEERVPGVLAVGQVVIPGTRVPWATTITGVFLAVGTAPAGGPLTVEVRDGATVVATVTIADGATTGEATGLTHAAALGARLTYHVTAVGPTTAGADLAVAVVGA